MKLPTHEESEYAVDVGEATALHQFIYDQEPAGREYEKQFREGLAAVIIEAAGGPSFKTPENSKLRFISAMHDRDFNVHMDAQNEFTSETTNAMWVGWEAAHGR